MTEGIPVVRMYTDSSGHTRFAKMQIPIEPKTGLGSVGLFSSLLVNKNLEDNTGDVKTQFAVTPVPPTTLIVLLAAIVPPPVNPAPATTLTSP